MGKIGKIGKLGKIPKMPKMPKMGKLGILPKYPKNGILATTMTNTRGRLSVSAEEYGAKLAAGCPTGAIVYTGSKTGEAVHD